MRPHLDVLLVSLVLLCAATILSAVSYRTLCGASGCVVALRCPQCTR
jgi:hypothetical protein